MEIYQWLGALTTGVGTETFLWAIHNAIVSPWLESHAHQVADQLDRPTEVSNLSRLPLIEYFRRQLERAPRRIERLLY
jgi:hypothetical protein